MKEEKDLERLFRERFKDYEATPERDLWAGIEDRLDRSSGRKPVPFYRKRWAAIAAVLAGALFGGGSLLFPPQEAATIPENITVSPGDTKAGPLNTPFVFTPDDSGDTRENTEEDALIQQEFQGEALTNSPGKSATEGSSLTNQDASSSAFPYGYASSLFLNSVSYITANELPGSDLFLPEQNQLTEDSEKASLLEYLAEKDDEEDKDRQPITKWAVNPAVAPVYYGSLSSNSPIEPALNGHSKNGETHLSYGVNVAYTVNPKLSLRTGVNRVTMGYVTNNVSFSPSAGPEVMAGNIDYAGNNLNIIINDLGRRPQNAFIPDVPKANLVYNGDMAQRMGYLEVPLELKYRMAGKRLGLHIIGGVSSLFLVDNSILLQSETLNTELGSATNLNTMNFSTNLGLGLDYRFTNALFFNLEPMFKYQWNTFSGDDGGFSPYLLGVYTGFSFRF